MPGFSDYAELKVLNLLFGQTAYSNPGTHYIALLTALPDDTAVDPTATEPTYTGYARLAMPNNYTTWGSIAAAAGQAKNAVAFTFGTCTVGSGTVVAFAICDALTLGTVIAWGSLVVNKVISAGDVPQFAANDLVISLD